MNAFFAKAHLRFTQDAFALQGGKQVLMNSKIFVGPMLYREGRLIPSLVFINGNRFQDVVEFPDCALSEDDFRHNITQEQTWQHQTLFSPLFEALQQDFHLSLSPDLLPLQSQEKINSILSNLPQAQTTIYDVFGLLMLPGLIDIHTHFRTPGQEWKEDFTTGSRAALKGGISTIFDMPNNLQSITTQELLDEKKALVRKAMQVNYGFYLGITDENIDTAPHIHGHCGYKVFLGSSTGSLLISDWTRTLTRCFDLEKPVIIHAEDEELIQQNMQRIGTPTVLDHPQIRNPQVAEASVRRVQQSLLHHPTPPRSSIIIAHISTQAELDIILDLQHRQFPVLAEVTTHHLLLDLQDFQQHPYHLKANPPLRSREETLAMQAALSNGQFTFVSSDHAPHSPEEKAKASPPSGMPGMEYTLVLLFDLFCKEKLSLQTMMASCAEHACRTFKLEDTGTIAKGYAADCVLLDPFKSTDIRHEDVQSKAAYTPFHGRAVRGKVTGTLVNGQIGYWKGEFFPTQPRDLFPN